MTLTPEQIAQDVHRAYLSVFSSPLGQVVLRDLAKAHHFEGTTFSKDPLLMAFQEGERNVVLRIRNLLNTPPDQTTLVPK